MRRLRVWIAVGLVSLIALWWFVFGYWQDMTSRQLKWLSQVFFERWLFPGGINPVHFTPLLWLILAIVFIAVAVLLIKEGLYPARGRIFAVLGGVVVIAFVALMCFGINDHSGSFSGSTTFVVENPSEAPNSLKLLADDTQPNLNGCARYADNDMRGCINQGTFNFEWDARAASATGAATVISRSSGGVSNTVLLTDSLTYLYGANGQGTWTAIRDGVNRQPIYGVSSWAGEGNVKTCVFKGQHAMNKSFGGNWGRSLSDEIAGKFPTLFYDDSDRWGYCDGDKPVIVIPVKEQVSYHQRTTMRAAGVLVINGSPSGDAQFQHVTSIKHGDFPGPVYSASLAKEQREAMGMIAGVGDSVFRNFGYEPTDVKTQSGNPSEYQLRDKTSGRIFWVTPMKPRSSDDQVLAAYSVIPADEVNSGSLNEQRIFVLPDGDSRSVNLDDLEARTRQALSEQDPSFYPAHGNLAEFLPLSGSTWQVYAELSGRVVYRITVPTDSRIKPTVVKLDANEDPTGNQPNPGTTTPTTKPTAACSGDLTKLSDKDLATCLSAVASEYNRRQGSKAK